MYRYDINVGVIGSSPNLDDAAVVAGGAVTQHGTIGVLGGQ